MWRLPVAHKLQGVRGVGAVTLDQCTVGLAARGPTTLLAVRCPTLPVLVSMLPGAGGGPHGQYIRIVSQELNASQVTSGFYSSTKLHRSVLLKQMQNTFPLSVI